MGLNIVIQRSSNRTNKNKRLNYAIIESSTNIDNTIKYFLLTEEIIVDSRPKIFCTKTPQTNPDPRTNEDT